MSSTGPNTKIFKRSDFYGLAMMSSFFGCLVPTTLAYILFSTKRMRRLPIFWVQAIALAFAFIYTCMEIAFFRNDHTVNPQEELEGQYWYDEGQAAAGFRLLVPLIADIAIVMKVAAFYPHHVGPTPKRLLIIGFPSVLLVARLVMQIITWVNYSGKGDQLTQALTAEITLQVFGNAFCSILLLRKTFDLARNKHLSTRRAQRRLAHLIEALLMTFIPAIIVQFSLMVIQFIDVTNTRNGNFGRGPPSTLEANIYRGETYCQQANVIVSVLFGLLATLWSSIRTRSEDLTATNSANAAESRKTGSEVAPAGPYASNGPINHTSTFGGSSRPSARTGSTGYNREEDRPLLSFLVDAHAPIDVRDPTSSRVGEEAFDLRLRGGALQSSDQHQRGQSFSSHQGYKLASAGQYDLENASTNAPDSIQDRTMGPKSAEY
ncbi:hypothetical protein OC845_003499 [Tilletia horrida]|nr:hypothetical protein OC845_003499 [Tilletia horrida]